MNPSLTALLKQYDTAYRFLLLNEPFLKTKRGFRTRFNRFCVKNSVISVTAAHLELIVHENQHITKRLRTTLGQLAETLAGIITDSEKEGAFIEYSIPANGLKKMDDSQLIDYCKGVYNLLIAHPNIFIKQGIVTQVRDTLHSATDVFNARVMLPEVQKKLTIHYKRLLEKLCLEMNSMLSGEINFFISRLRLANPNLVKEYKQIIKSFK